ncbi:PREDICTED: beta-D-glucosyl crocetin beta-1,6-glucosyltransferase-like [Ipomoea nil]|uniref:beta-D-glucosyl crocetin beta-1,6-glucosyltransferase-like n=1 Tax=Ipomoea nil TaxID=35883 RepID=UPI000901C6A0|nr:PREDICTED: beta-D-glucosyl crocetin beta-1,6-glucosyltransferase-like [Ipomoea nil]
MESSRKGNIVIFPFMAQGHIIPFLALALKLEQERGFAISFVNTTQNINKLRSSLPPRSAIRLLEIPFDAAAEHYGLPPGSENMESLPVHLPFRFIQSSPSLKPAFKRLLTSLVDDWMKWNIIMLKVARTNLSHTALALKFDSSWILDSGATDHISGNLSFFSNIEFSYSLPDVTFGDGSKGKAIGIGKVTIHSLSLSNVLYIPGCHFNLISVNQLTHSLNCLVTFSSDSMIIQNRQTKGTIGVGYES